MSNRNRTPKVNCRATYVTRFGPRRCSNYMSRGSEYCLRHKHLFALRDQAEARIRELS